MKSNKIKFENLLNPKSLFWLNLVIMTVIFVIYESKIITELQVLGAEPTLSGDIQINSFVKAYGKMIIGNKNLGIEIHGAPVLSLWILGERFSLQITEHSIAYIPSLILKLSWKICQDIICNRVASLLVSLVYLFILSWTLLKMYGSLPATVGSWFCIITTMFLAIKPSDSEMIVVYSCLTANTIMFWNLYKYSNTTEKKYFLIAIVSFLFSLNFHTAWGLITGACIFAGFALSDPKIIKGLKSLNSKDLTLIIPLFILLCFPLFIFTVLRLNEEGKSQDLYSPANLNIFQNFVFNLYHHIKTLWISNIHTILAFFLLPINLIVIFTLHKSFRIGTEHKAQLYSFTLLVAVIALILSLVNHESYYSTDLFMRSIKYIHFFAPFCLSSTLKLIFEKNKLSEERIRITPRIFTIFLLNFILLQPVDKAHKIPKEKDMLDINTENKNPEQENIQENFFTLLGKGFVRLSTQRDVANYLIQNNITNVYAIIPVLSIGFIDILSKDKIKAIYIPCHILNEQFIETKIFDWILSNIRKNKAKIVIYSHCLDKLPEKFKLSLVVKHKFKDIKTGKTEYFLTEINTSMKSGD